MTSANAPAAATWTLQSDLDDILARTATVWPVLDGARIFMTGGTGFIGRWLLETLRHAVTKQGVRLKVTVLTRDVHAFRTKVPHLADFHAFEFLGGDVCRFDSPAGDYSHLVHAATDASAHLNEHDPRRMFDTVVQGTRRALDFANEKRIPRTLFMSSGAVYGQQPWELERVPETWRGAPDCTEPRNAYAEAKRAAEMLCGIYRKQFGLDITIARIFALLGPFLSLDIHFAAGNFIRDAMAGREVVVNGNGLPCRSYLYAGDLTVYLLHMLAHAPDGRAYNLGSDETLSIKDLAGSVARTLGDGRYQVLGANDTGWNLGRYVPDTSLITRELGVARTVSVEDAILRTALWNGWKQIA